MRPSLGALLAVAPGFAATRITTRDSRSTTLKSTQPDHNNYTWTPSDGNCEILPVESLLILRPPSDIAVVGVFHTEFDLPWHESDSNETEHDETDDLV